MIRQAASAPRPKTATTAAGYIRMSGKGQDKSPAEQRAEIAKLAAREGLQVVEWFEDHAISGDSGTAERSGLADMLAAAKAGRFKILLAWHTNRISRESPMDALPIYNALRKAGVGLHTVCEGACDLDDFAKQLLLFVNQKASNDFLIELSAKSLRGKIANAKAGGRNGGPAIYGMDRALFTDDGRLVRRLQPGERIKMAGHHVRLVPSTDTAKLEAVRYAFGRMDTADLSFCNLARELEAKGYPSPRGTGWTHQNVIRILSTKTYIGTARWGQTARGKYHQAVGQDIIATAGKDGPRNGHRKQPEDGIDCEGAHEAIIDLDRFNRVQAKLQRPAPAQPATRRKDYPLSGLLYCEHCGAKMIGKRWHVRDRHGRVAYPYVKYVCGSYAKFGVDEVHTCGHHAIDAQKLLAWLVYNLQVELLGPGRDELVKEIKAQLQAQPKATGSDVERLQSRAAELDKQVGRLVKAIRTVDAAEVVEELQIVRAERDRVKAGLAQAGKTTHTEDLDAEAERIAGRLWTAGKKLQSTDPAELREMLHRLVDRIDCRWKRNPRDQRARYELIRGDVQLQPQTPTDFSMAENSTS